MPLPLEDCVMPAALFHAILAIAFLAVYLFAGEVLVGARRRRNRHNRLLRADGPETFQLGWHCHKRRGPTVTSLG